VTDVKLVFSKSQAETKFGYGLWKGDAPEERTEVKKYDPVAVKVQKKVGLNLRIQIAQHSFGARGSML